MHAEILRVTHAITERSKDLRDEYLNDVDSMRTGAPDRKQLSCGNLAHGMAACSSDDKSVIKLMDAANIGIVTAYNDMLSAHAPYETYPARIKEAARKLGSTAQIAGGVPAMCDGVTQGQSGMELSLFSRDVIAQATAVSLSHQMFDAALLLGVCDKIIPGTLNRGPAVWASARHDCPCGAYDIRPSKQRKSSYSAAVCRGKDWS
jgi:phosphogluconate dehydratase